MDLRRTPLKWRHALVGHHFPIRSDHRTLENFNTQPHLSRRQLRWSETLANYDYDMIYIASDALFRPPAKQSVDAPAPLIATIDLTLFGDEPPDPDDDTAVRAATLASTSRHTSPPTSSPTVPTTLGPPKS